jgi:hypothetical protein
VKFYKILNETECHQGMQYHDGLNVDILPFNPSGDCKSGGIYFAREDILDFLSYGPWIREVTIPYGEPVYHNPGTPEKWKAHMVILGKRRRIDATVIAALLSEGANLTSDAVVWAARNGHVDCLRALLGAGAKPTSYAVELAVHNGHVDCLRALLDAGAKPTPHSVECAARNGHAECAEMLRDELKEISK